MAEKEYIEREAAIKLFNFAVLDCLGMEPTIRAGDIIKALESIPAADVRPVVRGRWKPAPWFAIHGCDECDQCHIKIQYGRQYNFCPNCGADMREKS